MMTYAAVLESLRYVRWSSADADALRALLPHVKPHTAAIAEELRARELLEGNYDESYIAQPSRIGAVSA